MNQDKLAKELETASRRRAEALDLLHKTLEEYVGEVAINGRSTHNGMHRAMLLQNFSDTCTMLAGYLAEERRLIRDRLERDLNPETGEANKEAGR